MAATRTKHPLIGKVLRWTDEEDGSTYCTRRFIEPVSDDGDIWLMEHLSPIHGVSLGISCLMRLSDIVCRNVLDAEIYESFDAIKSQDHRHGDEVHDNDESDQEEGMVH